MDSPQRHSRLGIASFCIVLVGLPVAILLTVIGSRYGGRGMFGGPVAELYYFSAAAIGLLSIILGLVLGILGVCQKGRKRVFGILGILLIILFVASIAGRLLYLYPRNGGHGAAFQEP